MTLNEFLSQLTIAMVPILATGLASLIGVGVTYLSALVKAKFGEVAQRKTDQYLTIMETIAKGAVVTVQQTTVDRLKKAGQWNDVVAGEVKKQAVVIALAALGDLKGQIGKQLLMDVPAVMSVLVEEALRKLKAE